MKDRKLSSPHPQRKKTASKSLVRKKSRPYCWRDKWWTRSSQSQREASVLQTIIKGKLLSLGERFIEEKRLAPEEKLAEAAEIFLSNNQRGCF